MSVVAEPVAARVRTAPPRRLIPDLPRQAWLILAGDALSAAGSGLTLPFFLVYLHQVRGIGLGTAGLVAATVALASLVGNPLGGTLADRYGARTTLVGGLVVAAAGAFSLIAVHSAGPAFAAAAVIGLGASVIWPAQDALLAAAVPAEARSAAFSVRHATLNAGLGGGALVAAVILDPSRPSTFTVAYLVDGLTFLAFVPVLLFCVAGHRVPTGEHASAEAGLTGGYRAVFADRTFRKVWLLTALVAVASYGQYHSAFPAYATRPGGISTGALGLAFAANTFTVVGAQLFTLRALAGHRRTAALRWAAGGFAATWALTVCAGGLGSGTAAVLAFAAAMVVFALAETVLAPTLPALVNDLAPDSARGRYNGAATLAWTTGFLLGPAVGGFALDAGAGTWLFGGLIGLCAVVASGARRLEGHLPEGTNRIGG